MRPRVIVVALLIATVLIGTAAQARERYVLGFWRELGKYENNGCLYMRVWAMRQDGSLLPNVQVLDQDGYPVATTEANGRVDITFDRVTEPVQLQVTDGRGRVSDLTPVMCTQRYPDHGVYSYEMLFVLKDENAPGVFDTRLIGTLNLPGETNSDAPCTRSLAYRSWNPLNRMTDSFATTSWADEHGQTFRADGDRVRAVMLHGVVGGTDNLVFTAAILNGGPGGSAIASGTSANHSSIDPWLVGFGENACPLTSGGTYYVRMTRPGGLSAYTMSANNYADGAYYIYGAPVESQEIKGYVCCEKVGSAVTGTFSGTVRDVSGQPLSGALITVDGTYRKSTSAADGSYSVGSLLPGAYTIRVFKQGYTAQEHKSLAVAEGQNVQRDFVLHPLTANALQNPGFETGMISPWTKTGSFTGVSSSGYLYVPSHAGSYWAGRAVQNQSALSGYAYQRVNAAPGAEYVASCFLFTDSYSSTLRTSEFPNNCKGRIGLDPTGGTDPYSANIVWGPATYSHSAWSPITVKARAAGSAVTVFVSLSQVLSKPYNVVAFDDFHVGATNLSGKLSAIQQMPDGTHVDCFGQVSTASTTEMGGAVYVEETDRTRGIRVATSQNVERGRIVSVSGTIRTVGGERRIEADSVVVGSPVTELRPLGVGVSAICGRTSAVAGLLVRTWGRVTSAGTGWMLVSDGSASLKVYAGSPSAVGSFVRMTGVVGAEESGGVVAPVLRCRTAADVTVEPL